MRGQDIYLTKEMAPRHLKRPVTHIFWPSAQTARTGKWNAPPQQKNAMPTPHRHLAQSNETGQNFHEMKITWWSMCWTYHPLGWPLNNLRNRVLPSLQTKSDSIPYDSRCPDRLSHLALDSVSRFWRFGRSRPMRGEENLIHTDRSGFLFWLYFSRVTFYFPLHFPFSSIFTS